MAKIDWGKAGHHELDPARVQQINDFITPDDRTKKKVKRKARGPSPLSEAGLIAQREAQAFRQHLASEAARIRSEADEAVPAKKARSARQRASMPKLSKVERKAENEARKLHRKAVKKVVVVRQAGGQIKSVQRIGSKRREVPIAEREPLRQRWRDQLLGRDTDPDQPSG